MAASGSGSRGEISAKRIMVAVDDSEESMYALQWALDNLLTHKHEQHVIIMHAEAPPSSKVAMGGQGTTLFPILSFAIDGVQDYVAFVLECCSGSYVRASCVGDRCEKREHHHGESTVSRKTHL